MKTLKIKGKPSVVNRVSLGAGSWGNIRVILVDDDGSEEDITSSVRSVAVDVPMDDIITAKVEMFVQELDLEGVGIVEKRTCEDCAITLGDAMPRYPSRNIIGGVLCVSCHEKRNNEGRCFGS